MQILIRIAAVLVLVFLALFVLSVLNKAWTGALSPDTLLGFATGACLGCVWLVWSRRMRKR